MDAYFLASMTEDQRNQTTCPKGNSLRVVPSISRVLYDYQSLSDYLPQKTVQRVVFTGRKENLKLVNKLGYEPLNPDKCHTVYP